MTLRSAGVAIAGIVLVPLLAACDRNPDSTQAPSLPPKRGLAQDTRILKVIGSATQDVGNVLEGLPAQAVFAIVNMTSRQLTLESNSSCGCTRVGLLPPVLGPNQEGSLSVTLKTLGRNGGMHEFVDLYEGSTRVLTVWITGKVRSSVRVLAEPAVINIGSARVGKSHSQSVKIEVWGDTEMAVRLQTPLTTDGPLDSWHYEWNEPKMQEVTYQGGKRKYLWEFLGRVTFTAVKPGLLREALEFPAMNPANEPIGLVRVPIRGYVYEAIKTSPGVLYFGITSCRSGCLVELVVFRGEPGEGEINAYPSTSELELEKRTEGDGKITFCFAIKAERLGIFKEQVRVVTSSGLAVEIPVRGFIKEKR